MLKLYELLDSLLFHVFGYIAIMVADNIPNYASLGGVNSILSSVMRFFEGRDIYAGESIGETSNWVDIRKCGRPWLEFQVTTANYGAINLRAIVDYGRPVGTEMMMLLEQDFNMAKAIEYAPETNIFIMTLNRAHGGFVRLRTIDNTGAVNVTISVRGPGSFKSYEVPQ